MGLGLGGLGFGTGLDNIFIALFDKSLMKIVVTEVPDIDHQCTLAASLGIMRQESGISPASDICEELPAVS